MRRLLPALMMLFVAITLLPTLLHAQNLRQSVKKQLFVFPVEFDDTDRELKRQHRDYFEQALMRELVYNFPRFAFYEMPAGASLRLFLADADSFLLENAREIKQKRFDTGGRYGEEPITLDDLKEIVENGYAFVPIVSKVKFEENAWTIEARIEIHRTHDKADLGAVSGSTSSLRSLVGSLRGLDMIQTKDDKGKLSDEDITDQWESRSDGVVSELRTHIRGMDEFSIKAIVTTPGINEITINRGGSLGVRLDERYRVWSASDINAEGVRMLAYGKVREVKDEESRVQVLIGGWDVTYADQVIEDARYGINITPVIGAVPVQLSGFNEFREGEADIRGDENNGPVDLPEDGSASRFYLGVGMEYNLAALIGISELYATVEGGLVGVEYTGSFLAGFGVTKKYWFRRMAWITSVRYSLLGVTFTELEKEVVDGDQVQDDIIHGLTVQSGTEILLNPDWAIQLWIGANWLPAQTVLQDEYEDGHSAKINGTGLFFRGSLLFTL